MSLLTKLQIKPEMTVAILECPEGVPLVGDAPSEQADAVMAFVARAEDLDLAAAKAVIAAARRDALAWIAYPKGGQLGTDLNRDSLASLVSHSGVRPVRQVAIDGTWSALRFRPAVTT